MRVKKEGAICFFVLLVFLFIIHPVLGLGASPAKKVYNFNPGFETSIEYNVYGKKPDIDLKLYVRGNMSEYATLDKEFLKGDDSSFTVTLKLPNVAEIPGANYIYVGLVEVPDPELIDATIGTAVGVEPAIIVLVPFPGKYLQLELQSDDANMGRPVEFRLFVTSQGTDEVSIRPYIEIFDSSGVMKDTLYFERRNIASQQKLGLKKQLDTTGYNPGDYKAIGFINYDGKTAQSETDFKIGDLFVDILNYTDLFFINGLKQFELEIESGWNSLIDPVHAEVIFYNKTDSSNIITRFETPPTILTPWESKKISQYVDTSLFIEGVYDANITLYYTSEGKKKSSSEVVQVTFIEQNNLLLWISVGVIGLIIIIFLIGLKLFKKNGKKK